MSDDVRYVFDTNTLISAALFEYSTPDRALRLALKHGQVLVSSAIFEELALVLFRGKFDKYITIAERDEFLEVFLDRTLLIEPDEQIRICRDQKDNKFLEVAVCGQARCIVSGDNDLLALNQFRGIAILTAEEFLRTIDQES